MGLPYGNPRLNKPFKWHLARSGERDRANEHPFYAHIVHVTHPYAVCTRCQGREHGKAYRKRHDGTADGTFTTCLNLLNGRGPLVSGKPTSDGAAKTPGEAPLRQHPLADTVPPRTPAQRRQLIAAMELLKDAGDGSDFPVEILTLGDEVLWDYERYEIAWELGLKIRRYLSGAAIPPLGSVSKSCTHLSSTVGSGC